jgi:hypothetical protein
MPIHDWTRVPAGTFHHFHLNWVSFIASGLNHGILPKGYYAMAEQVASESRITPDVVTLQAIGEDSSGRHEGEEGGTAVATQPPRVSITDALDSSTYARKANRLAIRHISDDQVVALVEIVSAGNKSSRRALDAFVNKAADALDAGLNLLIIDLHPPRTYDPHGMHGAIWNEMGGKPYEAPAGKPLTLASYVGQPAFRAYVEPIGIGDPLPPMPLFLTTTHYVDVPLEESYLKAVDEIPARARKPLER